MVGRHRSVTPATVLSTRVKTLPSTTGPVSTTAKKYYLTPRNVIIFVIVGYLVTRQRPAGLFQPESATATAAADKKATRKQNVDDSPVRKNYRDNIVKEDTKAKTTQTTSSPPIMPTFLQAYIQFHNQMKAQPNAKYLMWRCPPNANCGGSGDRIKGVMSAFYTAVCTKRVLLIDWPVQNAPDVSPFLAPHQIDWTIPDDMRTQLLKTTPRKYNSIDTYGNPWFKNLTVPTPFMDDTIIDMRANLWGEHNNSIVHVNDTQCLQDLWANEPVVVSLNSSNNPHYLQDTYLFRMGFWTMFTFSDAVHAHKRAMQKEAKLLELSTDARQGSTLRKRKLQESTSTAADIKDLSFAGQTVIQPYVAVHIRTGIGANWVDPVRHGAPEDYEKFYRCAKRLQQGIYDRQRRAAAGNCNTQHDYQRQLPLLPIYVAADNLIAKQTMVQLDENNTNTDDNENDRTTIRVIEDMEIYHIDRSRRGGGDAEESVWAELSVLLESTCLVASRSGFSDLATWLQPSPSGRRCSILFNQCEDKEKIETALDALDFSSCAAK